MRVAVRLSPGLGNLTGQVLWSADELPFRENERVRHARDPVLVDGLLGKHEVRPLALGVDLECPNPMGEQMRCAEPLTGGLALVEGGAPRRPNRRVRHDAPSKMLECAL